MTTKEFDLLDELYFVQHYSYLKEALNWEDDVLLSTLQSLHDQGYIKCLKSPDEEVFNSVDLPNQGVNYYYLATKKGLMDHNTI
ncbi:hypothetical protein ACFOUP_12205 [Belliella kenyensis]|uniref:Uncharacterized protein n=1 Tax=Belliella kenyensis TaxID=1472724 RepID=A0ABV8ELF5_9BACT|nr:hypothetical protein [Belliella kenyensis]MCH7400728.1 hypothetical protein [Belliella kenyensis]MDN3601985.1 hypothetical protein [Belliella kenyensis]